MECAHTSRIQHLSVCSVLKGSVGYALSFSHISHTGTKSSVRSQNFFSFIPKWGFIQQQRGWNKKILKILQILPHRGEKRSTRKADSSWQMGARMEVSMGKSLEGAGDWEGKNIPQYQGSGKKRISRLWWKKKEWKDPEERKFRRKDLQAAGGRGGISQFCCDIGHPLATKAAVPSRHIHPLGTSSIFANT